MPEPASGLDNPCRKREAKPGPSGALRCLALPAGLLLFLWCGAIAVAVAFSQHDVRAAYLFNFASFIQWSSPTLPERRDAFRYCVTDPGSPVAFALKALVREESSDGKPLLVELRSDPSRLGSCHILYLGEDAPAASAAWLREAAARGVLTVGDNEAFIARGGMVALLLQDRRIVPMIHVERLRKAGLAASSKLLRFARLVNEP